MSVRQTKLNLSFFSICLTNCHLTFHNSKKVVRQCYFSLEIVRQILPPQNVRSNVRFKLTLSIVLCLKHLSRKHKTNKLSVKNYIYVRFPIILTGMWKVNSEKKIVKIVMGNKGTRRMTIPKRYIEALSFKDYALVEMYSNHLEIYPIEIRKVNLHVEGG